MSRNARRQQRRNNDDHLTLVEPMRRPAPVVKPLTGLTSNQNRLIRYLHSHQIVFAIGDAGTGKSYVAVTVAADMLREGQIERIVIARPMVTVDDDDVGALPGTLEEKIAPYIAPVRSILEERLGAGQLKYMIDNGRVVAVPVAFMLGMTLSDCFILADEAQNLTKRQFKCLLTRLGRNSHIAITGDSRQVDIKNSGLTDAIERISHIPSVAVVEFERCDVVRHSVVAEILQAYDDEE